MLDNQNYNLNVLVHHRLTTMESDTLVSNLQRIELEKELRVNPPAVEYIFYMLLGIVFVPLIIYLVWISIGAGPLVYTNLLAYVKGTVVEM